MTTEILTNNKERAVGLQACRDSFGAATVTLSPPKTLQQYTSPHRILRNKVIAQTCQPSKPSTSSGGEPLLRRGWVPHGEGRYQGGDAFGEQSCDYLQQHAGSCHEDIITSVGNMLLIGSLKLGNWPRAVGRTACLFSHHIVGQARVSILPQFCGESVAISFIWLFFWVIWVLGLAGTGMFSGKGRRYVAYKIFS